MCAACIDQNKPKRKGAEGMALKNTDIRDAARAAGVKHWQIARKMGVSEGTFCRSLRDELPEDKRAEILATIEELKEN